MEFKRLNSLGKLRLLDESLSLCGLQLGERFSLVTILCVVAVTLLGGIVCVEWVGSQ